MTSTPAPLFQAFTLSDLPNNALGDCTYNGNPLPLQRGYTPCIYEDRAWRGNPSNPQDFTGFEDWLKALPENAVALIDLEPLAKMIDARDSLNTRTAASVAATLSLARSRPDVKLYGYGFPFSAWTPWTRGFTPALAEAASATSFANRAIRTSVAGSLAGLLVSLYVPWTSDPNTSGLYWQRYIRRAFNEAQNWDGELLGCLCPTYVHTPAGVDIDAALLPRDRWREAVAAVADIYDGAAVWYAPTESYVHMQRHITDAAAVWAESIKGN